MLMTVYGQNCTIGSVVRVEFHSEITTTEILGLPWLLASCFSFVTETLAKRHWVKAWS